MSQIRKDVRSGHEEKHHHKMSIATRDDNIKEVGNCNVCSQECSEFPVYTCDTCPGYVYHKSCGDLYLKIDAPFFHDYHGHSLELMYHRTGRCDYCNLLSKLYSPLYTCGECGFTMDVGCATTPWLDHSRKRTIEHFSHPHPLERRDGDSEIIVKCSACELVEDSWGSQLYGCNDCGFFLHASCSAYPRHIFHHPLHPTHYELSLCFGTEFTCGVCCKKRCASFSFRCTCTSCRFRVCWKCIATVKTNIRYDDHEHKLCFVEEMGNTMKNSLGQCSGYDAYCTRPEFASSDYTHIPEELKRTKASMFRCVNVTQSYDDCNFRLHLLCGPLPSTIKHDCHIHALTLLDSLMDDDSGEYYCDVCETERDPRIRLYYCKDCRYSAHVHCVMSEVMNVLRGNLKDIELVPLGTWALPSQEKDQYRSINLTLKSTILKYGLLKYEKEVVKKWYSWDENGNKTIIQPSKLKPKSRLSFIKDEEITETLRLTTFSDNEFIEFCRDVEDCNMSKRYVLSSTELDFNLVIVKDYLIPRSLTGVLIALLDEHGDLMGANICSSMSDYMKSFVLFILCRVVKRMRATLVKDITKDLLREWFHHLKFVTGQGFNIGFALTQWESLVDVFLGIQAKRLEDEIPTKLKVMMEEIQRGLEMCEKYRLLSHRSEYMMYCLKKAFEARWHNSFESGGGQSSSIPRGQWNW